MKVKVWLISWFVMAALILGLTGIKVYKVDPFFHYHKPLVDEFFYPLNNQRSQNDGIVRHFDYDCMITGSSMSENFRSSEADALFGTRSVKVPFSGASYKEISYNLERGLKADPKIKMVIRSLDMIDIYTIVDENAMREGMGTYPTYLYDNNPFNDIEYLLNRDIVFKKVFKMYEDRKEEGFEPGITSFDEYSRWQGDAVFGKNTVCPDGIKDTPAENEIHLSDDDRILIERNIRTNVTDIADRYPAVDFYCYYPPYSVVYWNKWRNEGTFYKQLEAERYITELILPHENIHLFSLNNRTDITTDLNNYKDEGHYGAWVNSLILKYMNEGMYRLNRDNYEDYLERECEFYRSYDYNSLNEQTDYEADCYAGALMNNELTGAEPMVMLSGKSVADQEFEVNLDEGYNYLIFEGKKISGNKGPSVRILNDKGEETGGLDIDVADIDDRVHLYGLDLTEMEGNIRIVIDNGASSEGTGLFEFTNITLY